MPYRSLKMKCKTPVVSSRSRLRLAPVLVIAALMAFCPTLMRADTIALSFTGGFRTLSGGTFGYAFTLSSAILVTQLGIFDSPAPGSGVPGDGLADSHVVTIWTTTGTQEAQGTVPSGTGTTLTDGFRYVSIAPVSLPPGSYTIGGTFGGADEFVQEASTITTASGVSYDGGRSGLGNAFPPGNFLGQDSYFGPNFQFTTTSVPDTGTTFSLFGLSLTGLAFLRRKLC